MNNFINEIKTKGYAFPIKILEKNEANYFYDEYLRLIKKINSNTLKIEHKFKSHLLFKWLDNLISNKKIIDLASQIIGKNILCWNSIIFFKPKYSKKFVGWHEDKTYWKLKNNKVLTFSVAVTESLPVNGCLKILHERRNVEYKINDIRNNMLARGQDAIIDDQEKFSYVKLEPGESAVFQQNIIHGSDPNFSDKDRMLIALRYISTDNFTSANHKTAKLVSGFDNYKFYEHEPATINNFDNFNIKFHQKLMSKQAEIFAKDRLKKKYLSLFSFLVKINFLRGFYYKIFHK